MVPVFDYGSFQVFFKVLINLRNFEGHILATDSIEGAPYILVDVINKLLEETISIFLHR
jgi:hypothetical protein